MNIEAVANVLLMIGKSIPMTAIPATAAEAIIKILRKEANTVAAQILYIQDGIISADDEALSISAQVRAAAPTPAPAPPPT